MLRLGGVSFLILAVLQISRPFLGHTYGAGEIVGTVACLATSFFLLTDEGDS